VNADWFYSDGETRHGPVTEEALRRLVAEGRLRPTDLVWQDGMPDWVETRTIPALFPARGDDRPNRRRFDEDRPSRRYADDPDDDRPPVRRDPDDDDQYEDDRPRRRRRTVKPGQVQAVGIMLLIGGIWAILLGLSLVGIGVMGPVTGGGGWCCCVWPGTYYSFVFGILAIVRGVNMMNADDQGPPNTLAILQVICILNGDLPNCIMGIVSLVLLNDPKVQDYYRWRGFI
jgi:hypothetical protein